MAYPSPRRLQLRRGNAAAVASYLGTAGELVVDTTNWTLYVHDGVTIGGYAATVNTASITGNINSILNGTATFGNLIPSANVTYSLGNITHQWNDLYVSNNTIYVGGVPLSIDNTGNLTINGNVIPTLAYVNAEVANVQIDLSGYATTANVTAANVGMKGYVDQANTIQSAQITAANVGMKGYVDQANTIQSAQLTSANLGIIGYIDRGNTIQSAQITAANVGMKGYVDNINTALLANSYQQQALIGNLQASAYSNSNVSAFLVSTDQLFGGNVTIQGNLVVNGNVSYIAVNNMVIGDNIINLADLNPADSLDLGFVAHRTPSGQPLQHTGLVRDASANQWRLFSNVVPAVGATVDFADAIYDDLQLGNITSPTITAINDNITLANTIQSQQIASANIGIIGYVDQANSIQSAQITSANLGMKGYVDGTVTSANIGIIGYVDQANTIQASAITQANVGLKGYVDFANTVMKAYVDGQIIAANANVSSSGGTNYSNVNVAAYLSTATINTTGNITAQYISGNISITGNVTGTSPNVTIQAGAYTSVFDNQGNVRLPSAYITGNVSANYFIGNGALLTGIVAGSNYSNVDVANYLPTYSGNIANLTLGPSGILTFADGTTQITAGGGSYSNVQVATYLPTYAGTVGAGLVNSSGNILTTGLSVFGNTRIGIAGAISGQFHTVVGNIVQTSSGGAVYINTTGNVLAAAVVAGAVTSTGTVAVNAATGITTNQATFLLANATATTINMGGAATTIRMGTNTSNVFVGRAIGNANRELLLRAQGTWNTAINFDSNGGFNSPPYTNQPVIGGSGTGMTANYNATGGYLTSVTIYNPGTGYQNGDVLSVPGGIAGNSFTLTNYSSTLTGNSSAAYTFGIEGNLTVPGNVTARNFIGTVLTTSQTNITQVGTLSDLNVTGNVTVGNLVGVEANTRIISGNYTTTFDIYGNVTMPGNVIAPYFIGDGSLLTGIVSGGGSSYGNSNVAQYLPTYSGNIANIRLGSSGVLTFADGTTQITAGGGSYSNVQVATYLPTYSGNIVAANVWATGNATGSGALTIGPAGYTALPTTITQFTGNANTYTQLNLQNISTGSDATAEYVATANNGTDTTFFVDMGIANSNYDVNSPNNSLGTTIYPNDSYLYAQGNLATTTGGNLAIGTSTAGKSVKIFAGGINSANIVATVSNTGVAVTGSVSATANVSAVNMTASGNVNVTGYLVTAGGYGNISQVDYITANNVVATANVTVQGIGVTMPNRPAFRVNGTSLYAGAQSTANVNLKGVAVSTQYNQGNYFDATTGKFTAPIAGIYEVLLNARVNSSFNGLAQLVVLKNGLNTSGNVVAFWETTSNTAGATHFGVSGTVVLATGDYLSANILSGNVTFDNNDNWSVTYLG